jgi:hypothetical protein
MSSLVDSIETSSVQLEDLDTDTYVRFRMLQALVASVTPSARSPNGKASILDLGCGPVPFSNWYLGQYGDIQRVDTQSFGDAGVLAVPAGAPLPFKPRSFSTVVAMDVLEHMPQSARAGFLRNAYDLADDVAIFAFPQGNPDVFAAERSIGALYTELFTAPSAFLEEHTIYGLPVVSEVVSVLRECGAYVVAADNCLLSQWSSAATLNFLFAREFGDGVEKADVNRRINASAACYYPGQVHYRAFVVAARTQKAIASATAALRRLRGPLEPPRAINVPTEFCQEAARFIDRAFAHRFVPLLQDSSKVEPQALKRIAHMLEDCDIAHERAIRAETEALHALNTIRSLVDRSDANLDALNLQTEKLNESERNLSRSLARSTELETIISKLENSATEHTARAKAEYEQLQSQLSQTVAQLQFAAASVEERQKEVVQANAKVVELQERLDALIEQHAPQTDELQGQLRRAHDEIDVSTASIRERDAVIAAFEAKLRQLAEELNASKKLVLERDANIALCQQRIARSRDELNGLWANQRRVVELEQKLPNEIAENSAALDKKYSDEIEAQSLQLQLRQDYLEHREAELQKVTARMLELERSLSKTQATAFAEQFERTDRTSASLDITRGQILASEQATFGLYGAIADRDRQILELQAAIKEIQTSTTWRMTAGIRKTVTSLLPRGRRRLLRH